MLQPPVRALGARRAALPSAEPRALFGGRSAACRPPAAGGSGDFCAGEQMRVAASNADGEFQRQGLRGIFSHVEAAKHLVTGEGCGGLDPPGSAAAPVPSAEGCDVVLRWTGRREDGALRKRAGGSSPDSG